MILYWGAVNYVKQKTTILLQLIKIKYKLFKNNNVITKIISN